MVYVSERTRLSAFALFQGGNGWPFDIACHKEVENRTSVLENCRLPPHPPSHKAMSQHLGIERLKEVTNVTLALSAFRFYLAPSLTMLLGSVWTRYTSGWRAG